MDVRPISFRILERRNSRGLGSSELASSVGASVHASLQLGRSRVAGLRLGIKPDPSLAAGDGCFAESTET